MKKVMLDGPFKREHVKEFIEDIANTDNYTLIEVQIVPRGQLYDCLVVYDDGTSATISVRKKEE